MKKVKIHTPRKGAERVKKKNSVNYILLKIAANFSLSKKRGKKILATLIQISKITHYAFKEKFRI